MMKYKDANWKGLSSSQGTNIWSECLIEAPSMLSNGNYFVEYIGAFSYTGNNCYMFGVEKIGRYCSIAQNVSIGHNNHPVEFLTHNNLFYGYLSNWNKDFYPNDPMDEDCQQRRAIAGKSPSRKGNINIGHDVWIGMNATIIRGVSIGNGAIIAAGAVVTKDVPAFSVVGGNPAKVIKMRFDEATITKLEEIQWWLYGPEIFKDVDISNIHTSIYGIQKNIANGTKKYTPEIMKISKGGDYILLNNPSS